MIMKKKKSQVIIENLAAFMILFTLFIGITKVFLWFNVTLTKRHENWERTRVIGTGNIANIKSGGVATHYIESGADHSTIDKSQVLDMPEETIPLRLID